MRTLLLCTCALAIFMVEMLFYNYEVQDQYELPSIMSMDSAESRTLTLAASTESRTVTLATNSSSLVLPYPYTSFEVSPGKGLGQYAQPNIWNGSQSPSFDEDLNNLKLRPLPFLSNMRNPCWIEAMPQKGELHQTNILQTLYPNTRALVERSDKVYREIRATTGVTWRLRCLPYYYIIGATKCGSTDVNYLVAKHRRVVPPPKKEMTYWNRIRYTTPQLFKSPRLRSDLLEKRPTWPLNDYLEIYDHNAIVIGRHPDKSNKANSMPYFDKITGEATPNYVWDFDGWKKLAANRGLDEPKYILANLIKHVTPMARIILMIRDPIKRLWSEYMFFQANEPKSPQLFHGLVVEAIETWNECLANRSLKFCTYDQRTNSKQMPVRLRVSLYYIFVKDWLEVFGREQFLLVRLEDYAANKTATANQIFDFLHLERTGNQLDETTVRNKNRKSKKFKMLEDTEKLLKAFFEPWNVKLGKLMDDERFNYNS